MKAPASMATKAIFVGVFIKWRETVFPAPGLQGGIIVTVTQAPTISIDTVDQFNAHVAEIQGRDGYRQPAAFGIGSALAQVVDGEEVLLDTRYFAVSSPGENLGVAALIYDILGLNHTGYVVPTLEQQLEMRGRRLGPFLNDGKRHDNIAALDASMLFKRGAGKRPMYGRIQIPVMTMIMDLSEQPATVPEVYLRLYLQSLCKVKPNEHPLKLGAMAGVLPNVAWTNFGPFLAEDFDATKRIELMHDGHWVNVRNPDKFPYLVDYIVPQGVRIGDGDRVRLGAHLHPGTTVMHEGFCNATSGTLGPDTMVEGRLTGGVTVGGYSHIGGGFSFMGDIAGGDEPISVGEHFLGGANGGLAIPLGDNCQIVAGRYVMPQTRCVIGNSNAVVDAITLRGQSGITFVPNVRSGIDAELRVVPTRGAENMNTVLFAN